jgi:hypothetical protein
MLNARYLTMICARCYLTMICARSSSAWYAMETDLTKGVHHRHHRHLTDRTLTLAAAHIISATKGEKTSALQYWPSTLNLADRLYMSSSTRLRTSWRETECTRWRLGVLTDILQAAVDVQLDACPPSMRGTASATTMRGSGEEAARKRRGSRASFVGAVGGGREIVRRFGREEWEEEWEEREIGEVGRWGDLWRVPRNNAASRAPSPGVQAKPRVAPPRGWPHGNARFGGIPRACVEGALTRVQAEKMRSPEIQSTTSWLPTAWFYSSQANKRAPSLASACMRGETDRRAGWIRFPKQPIPGYARLVNFSAAYEQFSCAGVHFTKGARYYNFFYQGSSLL